MRVIPLWRGPGGGWKNTFVFSFLLSWIRCLSPSGGGKGEDLNLSKMKFEPDHNLAYNKALKGKAHSLREEMTKAEVCLWKYVLKGKRMKGYSFGRQRPVLHFIADFMCKKLKLIIEVDGYSHFFQDIVVNDIRRQKILEEAGFRVIRFSDEEVLKGIENVRLAIEHAIVEIEEIGKE